MTIIQKIQDDLTQALKAKKEVELLALRLVKSAIQNAAIAKRPEELTDDDTVKIIRSEIKKRNDSIVDYQKGNRPDLVQKEQAELEVIKKYLPPEMSDADLEKIIQGVIATTNAKTPAEFGKVMGLVMKQTAGQVDGGKVSGKVKEMLGK